METIKKAEELNKLNTSNLHALNPKNSEFKRHRKKTLEVALSQFEKRNRRSIGKNQTYWGTLNVYAIGNKGGEADIFVLLPFSAPFSMETRMVPVGSLPWAKWDEAFDITFDEILLNDEA